MVALTSEKENLLRDTLNRFPTYTDKEIAAQLKITRQTVATHRKKIDLKYDAEFVQITAGKFIKEFGEASDYWKLQIVELERLKSGLEPMDILAICKHQTLLREKILFLAAQGEIREVIKIMRSGKIPMLQQDMY